MTQTSTPSTGDEALDRVLANAEKHSEVRVFGAAQALQDESTAAHAASDGAQWDLEDRHALRRVGGLSTELQDVTEVEYRQLRLENVVLVGVYPQGAQGGRRELAA
ncbi:hypothetical protein MRBLWO12_003899 [Microbacterium sp. LWO12-1.2]